MTFKVGDKGQRYEVQGTNDFGHQVVIGWAEAKEGVAALVNSVKLHPTYHNPKVIDRQATKEG